MPFLTTPHEAFTGGFYRDDEFDYAVRRLLGHAPSGATEPGEVLATIAGVRDGDHEGWFAAWSELGTRLLALADELAESGRLESASGAYLRASRYLAVAVDSASDEELLPVFRQHRRAWEGFIDTTVYSVERVGIPYTGMELPGYLVRPAHDDEARPTLILNNGSTGSHASAWGDGAAGALKRGYNVLFFDGPGQQSMLFEQQVPVRPDWEKVITPVVDFLLSRDEVDGSKLAILGLGQGGYWVPRALAFEKRLAAAIVDPGVIDVATSWTAGIPKSLLRLFAEGKREAFDRDMALGLRFDAGSARAWQFRARPYLAASYFDTLADVHRYTLGDAAAQVTTPLFITAPEHEQFWPGQPERLAELVADSVLQPFTAAEGADFHGQPLARTLTDQRMFDWLDEKLGLLE